MWALGMSRNQQPIDDFPSCLGVHIPMILFYIFVRAWWKFSPSTSLTGVWKKEFEVGVEIVNLERYTDKTISEETSTISRHSLGNLVPVIY